MAKKRLAPVSPGEVLLEEFMKPLEISQNRLGRDLNVPITRINEIVHGKRTITVDTALRLARYFGTTAELWLNLQQAFDLESARLGVQKEIERTIEPCAAVRSKPLPQSRKKRRRSPRVSK